MLSFKLDDDFIARYSRTPVRWGFRQPNGMSLGELTFLRTYSREKPDGSKERWYETVRRVVEGCYSIQKDHCAYYSIPWDEEKAQASAQEMYDRMFNFKIWAPGRGLYAMGTEPVNGRRDSSYLYNCAAVSTANIDEDPYTPFCDLMDKSMCGVGVGFDTKGAGKIYIREPEGHIPYTVPDSREGWVSSLKMLLKAYFEGGPKPIFDYSRIRPAGSPIRTTGGIAPGPKPLMKMHALIDGLLYKDIGKPLSSRNIVDICNCIGKCVVSGGKRRTALIALGDLDDDDFIHIKDWDRPENAERLGPDGWGYTSNNSILLNYGDNMDWEWFAERQLTNGEPGFVSLPMMQMYGRLKDGKLPPEKWDRATLTNPCSLPGYVTIHTTEGPKRIDELVGKPFFALVDGVAYLCPEGSFISGRGKDIYRVKTKEGYSIDLTPDHRLLTPAGEWVEAQHLSPGDEVVLNKAGESPYWAGKGTYADGYLLGLLVGDGTFADRETSSGPRLVIWQSDEGHRGILDAVNNALSKTSYKRRSDFKGLRYREFGQGQYYCSLPKELPAEFGIKAIEKDISTFEHLASKEATVGFLRGYFDADGHLETSAQKGYSIRLSSVSRERLTVVQRMLIRLGIRSKIYDGTAEKEQNFPDGNGGEKVYKTKPTYRLVITGQSLRRFHDIVGFSHSVKREKLSGLVASRKRWYAEKTTARVESVEKVASGVTVYDAEIPEVHCFDANGFIAHNSEISLEPYEVCNLVTVCPSRHDSLEDFLRSIKFAFLYSKSVTLLPTHWEHTNAVQLRNRRIGCSVSGLAQFVEERGLEELERWLDAGYAELKRRDAQYSSWLGVRESVKVSAVKPEGSAALLSGSTPGAHYPTGRTYIRRIRFNVLDPLLDILRDAGYHMEPMYGDEENTVVVDFPVKGPQIRKEDEVSVYEKLHLAALCQEVWADNQVSFTLTFDPETEREHLPAALRIFGPRLKSLSCLPIAKGVYKQAPYEEITEEEYEEMVSKLKPVDLSRVYDGGEALDATDDRFCEGDKCEI